MIRVNDMFEVPWREQLTVREVMNHLGWDYVLITITVNGDYVPPDSYEDTLVPDDADVRMIHIAHGG